MSGLNLDEFADDQNIRDQLRKANRKLAKIESERIQLNDTIEKAATAAFESMAPPPTDPPKADKRSKEEEVAVPMAADWQYGKVTPDYNAEVAGLRIEKYAERIQRITDIQREDHPVKHAEYWLLGDLIEGEKIFPGQEHLIDSSLVDQTVGQGALVLRNFLIAGLSTFETVHVKAVYDNHGRLGHFRDSYHPDSNMSRILYLVAQQWFEATGELGDRITFDIPRGKIKEGDPGWYAISDIGGYKTLLIHGHQFKGGGGISTLPYPGINKKILKWRDMAYDNQMPEFHDVACGHWHTHATLPVGTRTLRIAGSPESYNVWAHEWLAASDAPSQRMMFVHPKRQRVTNEYRLWLP